jgi:hypothetical protein
MTQLYHEPEKTNIPELYMNAIAQNWDTVCIITDEEFVRRQSRIWNKHYYNNTSRTIISRLYRVGILSILLPPVKRITNGTPNKIYICVCQDQQQIITFSSSLTLHIYLCIRGCKHYISQEKWMKFRMIPSITTAINIREVIINKIWGNYVH